jgi:hypothetical protein
MSELIKTILATVDQQLAEDSAGNKVAIIMEEASGDNIAKLAPVMLKSAVAALAKHTKVKITGEKPTTHIHGPRCDIKSEIKKPYGVFDLIIKELRLELVVAELKSGSRDEAYYAATSLDYDHHGGGRNGVNIGTIWFNQEGEVTALRLDSQGGQLIKEGINMNPKGMNGKVLKVGDKGHLSTKDGPPMKIEVIEVEVGKVRVKFPNGKEQWCVNPEMIVVEDLQPVSGLFSELMEKANISDASKLLVALTHALNDQHRKNLDNQLVKCIDNETLPFFKSRLQLNHRVIKAKEDAEAKLGKKISWDDWFSQFSLFNGGEDKPEFASE